MNVYLKAAEQTATLKNYKHQAIYKLPWEPFCAMCDDVFDKGRETPWIDVDPEIVCLCLCFAGAMKDAGDL